MNSLKNKEKQQSKCSSFSAYYKHQNEPQYPYLLACSLQKSEKQFEQSRAMKLLGDWASEYEQMSQIIKYKYSLYITKIQKILLTRFEQKLPIEYCMGRFFICFYSSWKELTLTIATGLGKSDAYILSFIWYLCHNLIEEMNFYKQQTILQYLNIHFEEGLRYFDPQTFVDAKKILEIAYFINIHGCSGNFQKNANLWAVKMKLFEGAGDIDTQLEFSIEILRNRNLLIVKEKSHQFWIQKVVIFFELLEKTIGKMTSESIMDRRLLDLFIWMLQLEEVKKKLLAGQQRYLCTLLSKMRPKEGADPTDIFQIQKYGEISNTLYELFFTTHQKQTQNKVRDLLEKFTKTSISILNQQANYSFLDCLTDSPIIIDIAIIGDILKLLNSSHSRRTISGKVLLVLAKTITASLSNYQMTDDMISMCLKAFNDSLAYKITDPIVGDLRIKIAELFLQLMKRYTWEDNNKSEVIFNLIEETEKNSKSTNTVVLQLLISLVKKFGYAAMNLHKLEPLILEIHLKIIYDESNMHLFISLMIAIYFSTRWVKAIQYIQTVCSKNSSKLAPFYSFQAHSLIKSSDSSSTENQNQIIAEIVENRQKWEQNRQQVNLMLLEMYFLKLNATEAMKSLKLIDSKLLDLFTQFYDEGNYHLLALLASKTLPAAGGAVNLQKLQSYKWIRKYSFQILARSFYKSTSIYVCCIFSNIILRAQHPGITIKWLCQQQFLDYLYQGLNDFLTKEKKFSLEVVSTVMAVNLFNLDQSLLPADSRIGELSTLFKNVIWWNEAGNVITFQSFKQNIEKDSWLLPQFQFYYQQVVKGYYKDFLRVYHERKLQMQHQMESLSLIQQDL